jgi:two-component sensor histidine kinase
MEYWIAQVREQTAQIAGGNYQPASATFSRAPAGIAALSRDLDALALDLAERELVRKALASEVHHRVKNNLQIVTSLLNMQASRIENPAAREELGQTRARIGALAMIHRILFEQDDDGSQGTLDIARLIFELCAQFRVWHRDRAEIDFSCEAKHFAVPLDSATALALFAVEAVTNAYGYAFPDGRSGTVKLHFSVTDDGVASLSVIDDGVGFDADRKTRSMGRELMNALAQQLNGRLEISSSIGTGTEVRLDY